MLGSMEGSLVEVLRRARNSTAKRNEGIPGGETCLIQGSACGHIGMGLGWAESAGTVTPLPLPWKDLSSCLREHLLKRCQGAEGS